MGSKEEYTITDNTGIETDVFEPETVNRVYVGLRRDALELEEIRRKKQIYCPRRDEIEWARRKRYLGMRRNVNRRMTTGAVSTCILYMLCLCCSEAYQGAINYPSTAGRYVL